MNPVVRTDFSDNRGRRHATCVDHLPFAFHTGPLTRMHCCVFSRWTLGLVAFEKWLRALHISPHPFDGNRWLDPSCQMCTQAQPTIRSSEELLRHPALPLERIFAPEAVALIGAREKAGSVGRTILENLRAGGFILNDLRADKYEATLLELALAHRWRKAGAMVSLQPPVPNGVADFAADIQDVRFVVEVSTFPSDDFSDLKGRAPTIVTKGSRFGR